MISWSDLINHLQTRRIEWAVGAAKSKAEFDPSVAYGMILGRDEAIQVLLQDFQDMIAKAEDDEDA